MQLLIIFLSILLIHGSDYDIDNQQICTHRPFTADFPHNCSRTRSVKDITVGNIDEILYISIIFDSTLSPNTSLTITNSPKSNKKTHLILVTSNKQYMTINNKAQLILDNTTINMYLYDTASEHFIQTLKANFTPVGNGTYCLLKNDTLLPPKDISRIYYLYTNETNLHLDLSTPSYRISPFYNGFQSCFTTKTTLTTVAIILIVIVCVLTFVTLVLISHCLKKQLYELWIILQNRWLHRSGDNLPRVVIHGKPSA